MNSSAKRKPKHGCLYLVEVRKRNPWLHKVGITQNTAARFESLNDANAGRNVVLRVIYVKGYEKKEAWIKDYFSNRAYYYHPFRANGATEVFHFTWLDLAIITCAMEWWALMDDWRIWLAWHLFVFSAFGYGIYWLFPGAFKYLISQL